MRVVGAVIIVILAGGCGGHIRPADPAEQQPDTGLGGVAQIGGVGIRYTCTPVAPGAQRSYVETSFANSDIVRPPNLPAYTVAMPGLVPGIAGRSNGSGNGVPIGAFTFRSNWSGYQPGFTIVAKEDVFSASDGDLYPDEIFQAVPETTQPNMRFEGDFTFAGGTGRYQHASGSAASVAQQLGDGVHTAFVACGWITDVK